MQPVQKRPTQSVRSLERAPQSEPQEARSQFEPLHLPQLVGRARGSCLCQIVASQKPEGEVAGDAAGPGQRGGREDGENDAAIQKHEAGLFRSLRAQHPYSAAKHHYSVAEHHKPKRTEEQVSEQEAKDSAEQVQRVVERLAPRGHVLPPARLCPVFLRKAPSQQGELRARLPAPSLATACPLAASPQTSAEATAPAKSAQGLCHGAALSSQAEESGKEAQQDPESAELPLPS